MRLNLKPSEECTRAKNHDVRRNAMSDGLLVLAVRIVGSNAQAMRSM